MKILVVLACLALGSSALAGGGAVFSKPKGVTSKAGGGGVFSKPCEITASGGGGEVFTPVAN